MKKRFEDLMIKSGGGVVISGGKEGGGGVMPKLNERVSYVVAGTVNGGGVAGAGGNLGNQRQSVIQY